MSQCLSPKNTDLSQRHSVSNLHFFSGNLLLLSLITAIGKYIYCQNYKISGDLSQNNLSFNFESFLPNHTKMAAICHICQKGIFFTFCFVIYLLLTVYFSKYLQFPLNTIKHCQNYVNEHVFLEDNGRWKCKFFIIGTFFPSTLESFSKKTYEKTCRFYNIFSKYYLNCARLPNFMLWIFFSKICWPFQFNVHIFCFAPLLRENLWKDLPILWIIVRLPIFMCTLTKFCSVKIFINKMAALSKW